MFSISFRGDVATAEEDVEKYLLRRASGLTHQNGIRFFHVVSEKVLHALLPSVIPLDDSINRAGGSNRVRCFKERSAVVESVIAAAELLRFNFPPASTDQARDGTASRHVARCRAHCPHDVREGGG